VAISADADSSFMCTKCAGAPSASTTKPGTASDPQQQQQQQQQKEAQMQRDMAQQRQRIKETLDGTASPLRKRLGIFRVPETAPSEGSLVPIEDEPVETATAHAVTFMLR
jgi:hypothetical protein